MMGVGQHFHDNSRIEGGGVGHLQEALRGMQEMKVRVEGEGQAVLRIRDQVGETVACLHNKALVLLTSISHGVAETILLNVRSSVARADLQTAL